jgi:[CysO sulfur-carrier protein]-S-L-cysteine hydrolase
MAARSVRIRAAALEQMLCHARVEWPLECCGLLGGVNESITAVFPTANALASQREFSIDAAELIGTLRLLRQRNLKHLGLYHSHPDAENAPSARDCAMAFYPSCAYFILSPHGASPVRAFEIVNGTATELQVEIV